MFVPKLALPVSVVSRQVSKRLPGMSAWLALGDNESLGLA